MTISVGDQLPNVILHYVEHDPSASVEACQHSVTLKTHSFLKGKKAIIFSISSTFTLTCQEVYIPSYLTRHAELKDQGYDHIICVSITDGYIMNAFGKVVGVYDKIIMAGDGNGEFYVVLGLTQNLKHVGMGELCAKRFAIVVNNLVVKYVGVETEPGVGPSGAEAILNAKL
ncbi:thioredoxin-like protein [Jimgerdemannia flammicorona]|uniref:Thioredoxin-like protein n=1 Tax=Jimgerdemannia flammicorona TaxID=994334 RepID=A0A433QWW6_9FUNG|nr:thioredoxin-like protein [Jimgerdemannia flammicorona]